MMSETIKWIAADLNIPETSVQRTISLLKEGATIPFIARYRKEATGSLDEIQISGIRRMWLQFEELEKRKQSVLASIEEQGKLTEQLRTSIVNCRWSTELEDLYLPYKQKRKTKASIARDNGLEPLANFLMEQRNGPLNDIARTFVKNNVKSIDEALEGARHIIAEKISEQSEARAGIRALFQREGIISSSVVKTKTEEAVKYKDYFKSQERLMRCPSHRFLAMLRGAEEGFLRISIGPEDPEKALQQLERRFVKGTSPASEQIRIAVADSYQRLLAPSIETEMFHHYKEKADKEAIVVFAENLLQLLLAAPLGNKSVLAIDPGYRSGCKCVCLDRQGNLLHNETIYPHPPQSQGKQAGAKIHQLCEVYKIEAIAIGNGTAGRETEAFIQSLRFNREIQVFVVSEQGASVYSASPVAREEFPEYDVTVRGAVSIGRRLMDPLAELVKIDPKSIGVGQYQHDVDQNLLKSGLDEIVERAVNSVGVNLNTASKHLLTYVSGIGPHLAQNIVTYRKENGAFRSRKQLRQVARLGEKAFEQCAGFLRIHESEHPLDNTSVHPERYELVERMAKDAGVTLQEFIQNVDLRKGINLQKYVNADAGIPTLTDIMDALAKPGLDPRSRIKIFEFAKGITKPEHLEPGMRIPGIITNITRFGAFVDIGVKQDGLIHLSQMADRFISDPAEVVKLNQHVMVKVLEVDLPRKRIGLSLKE
jgi:uncharacterized protein